MHICTENGAGQAGSTSWLNTVTSLRGGGFVLAKTMSELLVNCENLKREELQGALEHPRVFLIVEGSNVYKQSIGHWFPDKLGEVNKLFFP